MFEVVFSEPVADFATGDVSLGGTAGPTTATVTGSGTSYTVSVTGMSQSGTVSASLAAGVAHDSANQPNDASTSTDNTVTYTLSSDPLADLAAAIKNANPPLSAKLATDLLGRIHTIETEVNKGKTGEACAELDKLAKRIEKALKTKPPGLTIAQANDFLKLVSAAKEAIDC